MPATTRIRRKVEVSDAELLRGVRDLFRLTLDEVEGTGIARRTWIRIESGEEREHTVGVQRRLVVLRDVMSVVGQWPYSYARSWAVTPLRGVERTPRNLIKSIVGVDYLRSRLRSAGEQTAT